MDTNIISDESSDADLKSMKDQLIEFGLEEENLSKEEMADLLKALNNSKCTAKEDTQLRMKTDELTSPAPKMLKRRYKNVRDRRMPWSLFSSNISQSEKARVLAVYIKLMAINTYRQARQSVTFATWPPALQIVEETNSRVPSLRSTRSGRSVPVYADLDDDSTDIDFVVSKPKKRKVSGTENNDGVYSNKVVSLKRKSSKDENTKPLKEIKSVTTNNTEPTPSSSKTKKDFFSMIED